MNFQKAEQEILEQMYGAAAPKVNTVNNEPIDNEAVSDAELAELAADAQARIGIDGAAQRDAVWQARLRRAELAALQAGPTAEAPCGQTVAAVPINEADWNTLRDLSAAVSPLSGRRYVEATDADGQRAREALFHAREAVMRGEKLDASLLAQIRANIATDQAEAARLKAKKDAEELARFRERHS